MERRLWRRVRVRRTWIYIEIERDRVRVWNSNRSRSWLACQSKAPITRKDKQGLWTSVDCRRSPFRTWYSVRTGGLDVVCTTHRRCLNTKSKSTDQCSLVHPIFSFLLLSLSPSLFLVFLYLVILTSRNSDGTDRS